MTTARSPALLLPAHPAARHERRGTEALVTGRANAIAFLLAEPQDRLFADLTYAPLLRGRPRHWPHGR